MLCTQVLNGLVTALTVLNFEPGREFDVVAVSFNPREGPGWRRRRRRATWSGTGATHTANGWHFLTGERVVHHRAHRRGRLPLRLRRGDQAVRARRGDRGADAEGAHLEVLLRDRVLGPRPAARIDRGVRGADRDAVRRRFLLFCYHYDPATGKYGASVLRLVRLGGILTVLAFLSFLTISLRRERRAGAAGPELRT